MIVFEGRPGSVVALVDAGVQGDAFVANLDGDAAIRFDRERSIITRMTISQEANVQFLHTLGTHIYIYVFGDRIGSIGLSGLSFSGDCDIPGLNQSHGGELMLAWYKQFRVSRRRSPVRVMVGNTPIDGFVTGFNEDIVDPMTNLIQWSVTLRSLPDD